MFIAQKILSRFWERVCRLQLTIPFDLPPDDRQAVLPEFARADVDAEAGGVGCEVPEG
jgi:hypothetical protein